MYQISAKIPAGATIQQLGPMLQGLLAERLGFKTHWEDRTLACYVLTIAKTGLKLSRSKYEPPQGTGDTVEDAHRNRYEIFQDSTQQRITGVIMIRQLATMLGVDAGRPTVDETGLDGYFDISFVWKKPPRHVLIFGPDSDSPGLPPAPPGSAGGIFFQRWRGNSG